MYDVNMLKCFYLWLHGLLTYKKKQLNFIMILLWLEVMKTSQASFHI